MVKGIDLDKTVWVHRRSIRKDIRKHTDGFEVEKATQMDKLIHKCE
jgi:hypothetical protein